MTSFLDSDDKRERIEQAREQSPPDATAVETQYGEAFVVDPEGVPTDLRGKAAVKLALYTLDDADEDAPAGYTRADPYQVRDLIEALAPYAANRDSDRVALVGDCAPVRHEQREETMAEAAARVRRGLRKLLDGEPAINRDAEDPPTAKAADLYAALRDAVQEALLDRPSGPRDEVEAVLVERARDVIALDEMRRADLPALLDVDQDDLETVPVLNVTVIF